jgi:hypothetical protein
MNRTVDLHTRLTRAALGFGALVIIAPFLCVGFTTLIIPNWFAAALLGLAMLPISTFVALMAWKGFEVDEFVHDAFTVLFLHQSDGLKRLYWREPLPDMRVAAVTLVAIPTMVCGIAGFCASLLSHVNVVSASGLYATFGFIYGLLLFYAIWYWVLPLMVQAREL